LKKKFNNDPTPCFSKNPLKKNLLLVTFHTFVDSMSMKETATNFHGLYQRYATDVYRFAFWLCGNSDDAKDIVSETFIRMWTTKVPIRTETVKAYLFTIARNLFLQQQRKSRLRTAFDENRIDAAPNADVVTEMRSELQQTLQNLQKLPETDRSALILRAYHALSYEEIARILQISVSAVKVKIHRARLKLLQIAQSLEEKNHGDN